jgi:hypothetical protein
MFSLNNLKVHQTIPGAGWRVFRTDLEDFNVIDDAVIAWVTFKERDCGSGDTYIHPLLKHGMLSDIYGDVEYIVEYLRPDATPEDVDDALLMLSDEWSLRTKKKALTVAVEAVIRG